LKNRKIILTLITLIVITSAIIMNGCGFNKKTSEYCFPAILISSSGQTQESAVEDLQPDGSNDKLITSVKKGSNGSVVLELNDKQLQAWLNRIEDTIKQCKQEAKNDGCEVIINDDYTQFTYKLHKDANVAQYVSNSTLVATQCLEYQVFTGVNSDEVKLNFIVTNIETGKVMVDAELGEEFTINPEDWKE